MSLSAGRAWIEITSAVRCALVRRRSLSARRAWIEIYQGAYHCTSFPVALRKESVDRNTFGFDIVQVLAVALRKESVDRNTKSSMLTL